MLILENIEFLEEKLVQGPFIQLLEASANNSWGGDGQLLYEKTSLVRQTQNFSILNLPRILQNLIISIQNDIYQKLAIQTCYENISMLGMKEPEFHWNFINDLLNHRVMANSEGERYSSLSDIDNEGKTRLFEINDLLVDTSQAAKFDQMADQSKSNKRLSKLIHKNVMIDPY